MSKRLSHSYHPHKYNRDHARPVHTPAPGNAAMEARLAEVVNPALYALTHAYHALGLRWRVLNLPVMLALVLGLIWRQVPSVTTLLQMLERESVLWAPPQRVSQQAFSLRLRTLPAELFRSTLDAVLSVLLERSQQRRRAHPVAVQHALQHFTQIRILDASTLEAVFRKVGLLRESTETLLGGKVLALLDLPSKLPVQVWWEADAMINEKTFLDQVKATLTARTLLLIDRGFYAFPFFDWLTAHRIGFVTRARAVMAYEVQTVLVETPRVRDRIIVLGRYRSNRCQYPLRLVEICIGETWHRYLTNVLDPGILPTAHVADLYGRRWRIEEAFQLVKRLLGLSYLWTGAQNGLAMQVWATWLLYAVLVDLSDAVANALDVPLEQISIEMVYRSLYHFTVAYQRGEASDPVAYLASQSGLGIVKRRRKHRERVRLDNIPPELNL